jgi:sulfur-carrier protein adenylyltransferase/sulfurtransferase
MFALSDKPIDEAAWRARLVRPEAGALVVFEGRVRNHHRGLPVERLDYEAFAPMAESEGSAIVEEAERRFPGCRICCLHRVGSLAVGEIAVWIGVTAAHRDYGYRASRYVIEEIKQRLPIWKKEHHPGLDPVWVNCGEEELARRAAEDPYARQSALPEVGIEGQARIQAANLLVVGAGGLGCPALLYLAAAGVGRLTVVDGSRVEASNLHRQVLFGIHEVGESKAERAVDRLRLAYPTVTTEAHDCDFSVGNARALVAGRTAVLDCTDNFASRFLIHDTCMALDVPLVQASVHRFEGMVNLFRRGSGGCLRCLWGDRPAHELDDGGSCSGGAVWGPAVGLLGALQASEALKLAAGCHDGSAFSQTILLDLRSGLSATRIDRPADPHCRFCQAIEQVAKSPVAVADEPSLFLSHQQVATMEHMRAIALLAPGESAPQGFEGWPLDRIADLDTSGNHPIALSCRFGLRSAALARQLRASGRANTFAVSEGFAD